MTANKKKRYLILGTLTICLLAAGVALWLRRPNQLSSISTPPYSTIQINVPTIQYPTIPASAPTFTVTIHSIGSSTITGTATFEDIAGKVAILLHLDGLPSEENEESIVPAELRYGTCTALGSLAYPMSAPDAGESETDLPINLKQFNTQRPMAVTIYQSIQDHTVIACGDIP